jgi:hypothetical protein
MDLLMSMVESEQVGGEGGAHNKAPEADAAAMLAPAGSHEELHKWGRLSIVEKKPKKKQKKTQKASNQTALALDDTEKRNFELTCAEYQIGRTPACDITFNLPFVSGKVSF